MHVSYIVEATLSWQEKLNIGDWLSTPVLPTVLMISFQAFCDSFNLKIQPYSFIFFFKVWRLQSHEITSGVLKGQLLAIAAFTSLCSFVWRSCPHRFMSHTWTPASYISILHIVCLYFFNLLQHLDCDPNLMHPVCHVSSGHRPGFEEKKEP